MDVTRPLAGTTVRASGDTLPLRVAAARLRALGCTVEHARAAPPDAPAGRLAAVRAPFGGALPECRIGWSGPVPVPMRGEHDVQAACGIMQVHGRAAGGPRVLPVDFASACAGVLAAQAFTAAALAALHGRTDVAATTSVAQAAALALTQYVAVATAEPGAGRPADPAGDAERTPPFRSSDGVVFELETFDAERWLWFWSALGAGRAAIVRGWPPFQQRFATATCALPPDLAKAAGEHEYRAVRDAADAAGVSAVPVRPATVPPPPAPASPWRLRAVTPPAAPPAPPPAGPGPLAGLRVVESTNRVQGPLAGHLLALLGADVVRLEPPGGDPLRGVPPLSGDLSARFLALNRGKSAVEADLTTAAGRGTALRLAASADAFLQNWPPGRAARFRLGAADLAAVRPSLVYAHAGGWADALPAPQPMGTDYLVQAHSGVAALVSGPTLLTVTDVLGALIAAEGAVAALLARARTGAGVRAATALIDAARLLRTAVHTPVDGAPRAPVVTDLAAMAADPAYASLFETDGTATYSRAPWTFDHPQEPHP
ncbi:CoA transferase [Actinomadura rifamycini]|uniref:CoA transferase n=1 Tax=Actinomadura rifamycini TaxID=31962 RepID=UPI000428E034|nr:CoA transferase [Actinomadura rifamycini]